MFFDLPFFVELMNAAETSDPVGEMDNDVSLFEIQETVDRSCFSTSFLFDPMQFSSSKQFVITQYNQLFPYQSETML